MRRSLHVAHRCIRHCSSGSSSPRGFSTFTDRFRAVSTRIGDRDVIWKADGFGRLAAGSCTLHFGKTTVLAAAVCADDRSRTSDKVLFNVGAATYSELKTSVTLWWAQVEYKERLSATGRIPRNRDRRDSYGTDREVFVGRSIDRAFRPLFPLHMSHDVTITASVLSASVDDMDPVSVAINAASGALTCSDIPWYGPVGACRVAMIDGSLVVHPSTQTLNSAQMALLFAGTQDRIVMLEAEGQAVRHETDAYQFAVCLRG